ncbi:delta-type opioid receptor isoform X1 [Electrophorus electricus]|uniref:delta-type opioid receptor isoform X1 n=2 Tax=Electrophorus electricus TaxID=8005 RepID=UPI0015CF8DE7|nr:delta-type opioid receptor isoform X1 [Electrophorus electricus]XP_035378129.1 delta-type opioid receptor isoform X1 [Electrophorus electricus]
MEFPDDLADVTDKIVLLFNETLLQGNLSAFDDTYGRLPTSVRITIVVVYLIVCVVGLVGNCLVMYVIIRYTKMKTATNIYIFNLALADALVLATLPFQGTDVLLDLWPFGLALCKAVVAIDYYNMFTSVFTLTVMSVDRYIAVCHPVHSLAVRTPHRARLVNLAVWALASAIGVPVMIMGQVEAESNGTECMVVLPDPLSSAEPVFGTCVFLFSFLIPVVIISVCYGLMVRRLHSVRHLSGSREKDRNLRRISQMVLAVVAAFVLCWMPVQVLALLQALGKTDLGSSPTAIAAMHFCIALGYANSSLNPLLYAFLDENFKRCFNEFCMPTGSALELEVQRKDSVRKVEGGGDREQECRQGNGGVTKACAIPRCEE